jgi:nicotinamidase-related amidase
MALTTLDEKTALIVIDLQKGVVGMPTAHPSAEVVSRAAALAEAFRRHGLPVVLVNVDRLAPGRLRQPGARAHAQARDGPPLCESGRRAMSPAANIPGALVSRQASTTTPRSTVRPAAESLTFPPSRALAVLRRWKTTPCFSCRARMNSPI